MVRSGWVRQVRQRLVSPGFVALGTVRQVRQRVVRHGEVRQVWQG